jgi:hypothetical protein
MSDDFIRHLVAFCATAVTALAFFGGYLAGPRGWWWAAFALLVVYGGVYRIINK